MRLRRSRAISSSQERHGVNYAYDVDRVQAKLSFAQDFHGHGRSVLPIRAGDFHRFLNSERLLHLRSDRQQRDEDCHENESVESGENFHFLSPFEAEG